MAVLRAIVLTKVICDNYSIRLKANEADYQVLSPRNEAGIIKPALCIYHLLKNYFFAWLLGVF